MSEYRIDSTIRSVSGHVELRLASSTDSVSSRFSSMYAARSNEVAAAAARTAARGDRGCLAIEATSYEREAAARS
jgi:hypothetical protein